MSEDLDDAGVSRTFWLTHMRIGFGVFLAESVAVAVYLGSTPDGPHRATLWITVALWALLGTVNLAVTPWVARRSWRSRFSVTWTVLSACAVAGVARLDGGVGSPLVLLLFLPISYAAWAFSPSAAAACGVASLMAAACLAAVTTGAAPHVTPMLLAVLAGATVLSVAAARNRVRREEREAALARRVAELASTDELTGCAVRRVFHERLAHEITRARRHGYPLTLMMIDVDHFKKVNDNFGHLVGDHVLAAVGAVLREQTRQVDLASRIGGDEFAVLMPDTEPEAAVALAARIRDAMTRSAEVPVTVSIGISGLDPTNPTTEQLLDAADFALYQVKRSGRDGVSLRRGSMATVSGPAARTAGTLLGTGPMRAPGTDPSAGVDPAFLLE